MKEKIMEFLKSKKVQKTALVLTGAIVGAVMLSKTLVNNHEDVEELEDWETEETVIEEGE